MSAQIVEQTGQGPDAEARQLPPSMVERMSLILDVFGSPTARLTLEEVARSTHLPRSTTHRILDQLVKLSWLTHTPFGYSLGKRALDLGGGDKVDGELRAAAAPVLHDLQVRTGLVAHLASLDGADVVYLDKLGGRFATAVPSRVGGHAPAYSTALGKAMLAWLEPEEVDRRLAGGLNRFTGRTIGDLDALHQELHRIRSRNGIAIERGESFPDIACAAASVRGPEGPLGAISLVGDLAVNVERIAPLVLAAARAVSVELFGGLGAQRQAPRRDADLVTRPWTARTMGDLVGGR
ncbi:putative HTH-type transcriptional regulator RhmR [Nocardioides dokdonensis FR1436]|uniref:Putative HTH-type transcriptional regulator RhmR n=1 Tax=Nocardioides dokdonensis FR1436 TaxID=1300347 RepID=A0A1A9GHU1_9ACTN|nr:IclR family transcriptional regulator [Nocardioides dokdonensis]ANH37035.1 putative HTH-type transcriptional regulator RhmR [Nocardioides dokdonensis FR1436]